MSEERAEKKRLRKEAMRMNARFKKEAECHDFELFVSAYEDATGRVLECIDVNEAPDFICKLDDGKIVGVELTQPIRSPDQKFWDSVIEKRDQMDLGDAVDSVDDLLVAKLEKVEKYSTTYNILVMQICEADFNVIANYFSKLPEEDFQQSGFDEIWLGDYNGVQDCLGKRDAAHKTINLFGLFPTEYQEFFSRPDWDAKPYG